MKNDLLTQFGRIDVYVFDQLLRGAIRPGMRVLDAGCGDGRNLVFLMRAGYEVFAADEQPAAIEAVRALAGSLAPGLDDANFRVEAIESLAGTIDTSANHVKELLELSILDVASLHTHIVIKTLRISTREEKKFIQCMRIKLLRSIRSHLPGRPMASRMCALLEKMEDPFLEDTTPSELSSKQSRAIDTRRSLREDAFQ